jgi:hypothetical protein
LADYDECVWWCQRGDGFPHLGPPGTNKALKGMRWTCPCGRTWVVKGDDWYQEFRLEVWFKDHPRAWWRGVWQRVWP